MGTPPSSTVLGYIRAWYRQVKAPQSRFYGRKPAVGTGLVAMPLSRAHLGGHLPAIAAVGANKAPRGGGEEMKGRQIWRY